jgi:acyl dehydratase
MATPVQIDGIEGLKSFVGKELGACEPFVLTQEDINRFADVTGDHQWIHTDPVRAANEGPFGGTVGHGYYLLSIAPRLLENMMKVDNIIMALNYGANKVRFPEPARVNSRITMKAKMVSFEPKSFGSLATLELVYQAEGSVKPCCLAEVLYLFG